VLLSTFHSASSILYRVKQKRKENGNVSIDCKSDAITLLRSSRCGEASKRRYSIRPGPIAINDVAPPRRCCCHPDARPTSESVRGWATRCTATEAGARPAGLPAPRPRPGRRSRRPAPRYRRRARRRGHFRRSTTLIDARIGANNATTTARTTTTTTTDFSASRRQRRPYATYSSDRNRDTAGNFNARSEARKSQLLAFFIYHIRNL